LQNFSKTKPSEFYRSALQGTEPWLSSRSAAS